MAKQNGRKRTTKTQEQIDFLTDQLQSNNQAKISSRKSKTWSIHDLKKITPKTEPQRQMFQEFFNGQHIFAHGATGTGKAQPLRSHVLTPTGWKRMKDIKVGDAVITPKGTIAFVTAIFPQRARDVYTLTFADGGQAEACKEHLWECYISSLGMQDFKHIVTTNFLINLLKSKHHATVTIDTVQPIQYPEQTVPLDPYSLGVFLGDIGGPLPQAVPEEDGNTAVKHLQFDINVAYVAALKQLQLYCCDVKSKFIPNQYKNGSIAQRLHLIQGLIDINGEVEQSGEISFYTISNQLAKDVQQIIWSLGGTATIEKQSTGIVHEIAYVVSILYPTPQDLFRVSWKREDCKKYRITKLPAIKRTLKSIKKTSREKVQCIMIDDPDHLYITDDYITTHNTYGALFLALNEALRADTAQTRVIIVKSIVPTRDVGFLPGTLEEKISVYEKPYDDIVFDLVQKSKAYNNMKETGLITFMPTSFIRGITLDNAIIVIDEVQSMTAHEINSVVTRVGINSRLIIAGDITQTDLRDKRYEKSGLPKIKCVINSMNEFTSIEFTTNDIIRSGFVKNWIATCDQLAVQL